MTICHARFIVCNMALITYFKIHDINKRVIVETERLHDFCLDWSNGCDLAL